MTKTRTTLAAVLVFCISTCFATTYYVSTTGSNSNAGTIALPFKTITYAYSKVTAGDVIIVKPGIYTDYTPYAGLNFTKNGTAANPITIKSQYKWKAVIDAGNVSDHIECISLSGNYHIIDGFDMRGAFECGLWIKGTATGNQILNNNINHCGNIGDPNSASGQAGLLSDENTDGTKYYGNYIHHNGRFSLNSNLDHGMYLTGDNEIIANNIITDNCAYGLHIAGYSTVSNMKVYNNVIARNGRSGIMLWMDMDGVDIRNNILYNNAELGLLCYDAHGTGVVIDYNMWYGNPQGTINMTWAGTDVSYTSGSNLIATYPNFINDTVDYHLKPNSAGIDAGIPLSPIVINDMDSTSRPQGNGFDMGVYEYQANATGISQADNKLSVLVFPNPVARVITVQSGKNISEIEIMNALGEPVYVSKIEMQKADIDLENFPNGNYFIQVRSENAVTTKKIIIQR